MSVLEAMSPFTGKSIRLRCPGCDKVSRCRHNAEHVFLPRFLLNTTISGMLEESGSHSATCSHRAQWACAVFHQPLNKKTAKSAKVQRPLVNVSLCLIFAHPVQNSEPGKVIVGLQF